MGILSNFNVNMPESKIRQNYHEECEAMINKQINMEFYASYVYLSMGSYFNRQDQALHGFGKHFMGESEEERKHGIKLMENQTKRGGRVVFQDIAKPSSMEWGSPAEAMEAALELEKTVNQSLLDLHKRADSKGDAHLCDFLEAEYLGEQVEGIKSIGDWIVKIKRAGTVWVCILWTRRLEVKYPLCVSSPHIGKLFNSRQNYLLSF